MPPAGSASAIVGRTVEGHHLLHIEGYSRIKEDKATGNFIRSCRFIGGDRHWRIDYYPNGERQSAMNQHLLVAADKYNLERLKQICEDNLCKHIETGTAATILTLAEQHNSHILKKVCTQFLSSPSALKEMVETDGFEHLAKSCPSVLKELISKFSTST
ncbi:hypothetical protein QOZ80_2AG0125240 [Eleusine coracana subsp. coracana]|nr:hypothetical protein QOZ80_2AG0125240 [Eleusine coracana subsp. coracana]